MKKFRVIIAVSFIAVFIFVFGYLYYQAAINRPHPGGSDKVDFTVSPGEDPVALADQLKQADLINSANLFKIYLRLSGVSNRLQAGHYRIPKNLSLSELTSFLQHGVFDQKLTFIEGWRREEMAKYAETKFNPSAGGRIGGQNEKFGEEFLEASTGEEGFLFPDTYFVPFQITAVDLVRLMKDNFKERTADLEAKAEKNGLKPLEWLTLASIVEREVKFDEDRPIVAGILKKRWQNDWSLEADATVQYALYDGQKGGLDFWPEKITAADLEIDSPYNTRKYRGLPPGPICNPGLAALKAVAEPAVTEFWYYLSDQTGKMYYAATLAGHNRNAALYLKQE